jgi:hypothetical protein
MKKITTLKRTVFTLISIGLLLGAFEAIAWLVLLKVGTPEYVYHADYMNGYKYDPYIAFRSQQFPLYGNRNGTDSSAIYITGGSTAIGVGVRNLENSYYRILENHLIESKLIKPNQMVNLGVPGFVSSQESGVYKNWIFNVPKAPRFVIAFTGFNDAYFYLHRTLPVGNHEFSYAIDLVFRKGYPPPNSKVEQIKNYIRRTSVYALQHRLFSPGGLEGHQPIQLASDIFDPEQFKVEPTGSAVIKEAAANFLDNCKATGLLAKYQGTQFIVLLQPVYYYGGELSHGPNEWFSDFSKLELWIAEAGRKRAEYDEFYQFVLAGLSDLKRQGILDYWDYRDKLKAAGPVYLDPVHFDEKGSNYIAEAMYKDLQEKIRARPL